MTGFAFRRFGGQVPRISARLIREENAQTAVNTKLSNGKLRAFKRPKFEFQAVNPGPTLSIYKYRGGGKEGWLHWNKDVDVVKAPLAGDDAGRIYITGDGRPKFADSTTVIEVTAKVTVAADPVASSVTVAATRGYSIGDQCTILYGGGITQNVTLTSVIPAGSTLVLGITPATTTALTTISEVRNNAKRFPLAAYDLGVPAPAQKLSLTILSGGINGTEGVAQGEILAVSDVVVSEQSHTDTSTIGAVQGGNASWTLSGHVPYHDFSSFMSDGQVLHIEASCRFNVRLRSYREVRDVIFEIYRNPAGDNTLVASTTKRITRESPDLDEDASNGWTYEVGADGVDVPIAGSHVYRVLFSPVPGLQGSNNNSYTVTAIWKFKARHSNRIKITLQSGHGLVQGDTITLSLKKTPDTPADRDLDGKVVEVIGVDGDDIIINAPYGGTYAPGGKWQKAYSTDETGERAYAYTYVASFGGQDFEGPPSPVSSIVTVALGGTVRLTGFIDPNSPTPIWDTTFTKIRVYRLGAGESGESQYMFHSEHSIPVTQVDDNVLGENLGEVLPTSGWELPPEDLRGLIELPEGGAAAFTKKEFCMAEPYYLHSWPARNRRTTHDEIVAIGAFGSSIGIATKGTPYIVTGLDPATVSMERIEIIQPCLSKRGSVDMGYGFVYPSPDGLVMLSVGRADVVTRDLFTHDEWMELNPTSFSSARYGDCYLCFYDASSLERKYEFNRPTKGGFIINPKDPVASLVFLDFWASSVWSDPQTGLVYICQGEVVKEFDADALELQFRWKSKEIALTAPVSMGLARVDAKQYPVKLTVFADGRPLRTCMVTNRSVIRVPDETSDRWSVEVESVHEVEAVYLAETAQDLKRMVGGQ